MLTPDETGTARELRCVEEVCFLCEAGFWEDDDVEAWTLNLPAGRVIEYAHARCLGDARERREDITAAAIAHAQPRR